MSAAASLPPVPHADVNGIPELVANLRARFDTGVTRPLAWRLEQLKKLEAMLRENEATLSAALTADLRKPEIEGFMMDIGIVATEIADMRKRLKSWMKPQRAATPMAIQPAKSFIVREPLGVVLIIAPWNYPIQLAVAPLAAALAAGNCAVVKPSELTPHTSGALAKLIAQYLDADVVALRRGRRARDHGAARGALRPHLLHRQRPRRPRRDGGRGEAPDAGDARARRQEPVHRRRRRRPRGRRAPHRLGQVPERRPDLRRARLRAGAPVARGGAGASCSRRTSASSTATIRSAAPTTPASSSTRHFDRLAKLLRERQGRRRRRSRSQQRYVAPTVLLDVSPESPVMQDEIFGPILPVLPIPTSTRRSAS